MRRGGLLLLCVFVVCCAAIVALGQRDRAAPPFTEFVYAATSNGTIRQYGVRSNGMLALLPVPLVRLAPNKQAVTLVLHPTRPFAYATTVYGPMGKTAITTYRIQSNGSLVAMSVPPLHVEGIIRQLVPDKKGRFLFAVRSGQVLAFRYRADGTLSQAPSSSIDGNMDSYNEEINGGAGPAHVGSLIFDPLCRFAYNYEGYAFGDHSESTLTTYDILPSGRLRKRKGEQNLDEVGFDVAGRWAYVTSFESSVALLSIRANGKLTKLSPQQFKEASSARVRLLDTRNQIIVLENGNKLIFANASSNGRLKNWTSLVLPYRPGLITLESLKPHFLVAALQQSQTATSLFMIYTGDATHQPKIIQNIPLGAEDVRTIVSRRVH